MSGDDAGSHSDELRAFGFDSDAWIDHADGALRPEAPGTLGEFEIVTEVHRGGQGVVYRAIQPGTKRPVAIKRLLAGPFASAAAQRRFEREIEAAATLRHPGIVTVYGMKIVDGCPIMAMEWVEGPTVAEWARPREGPAPSTREVLRMFLRICAAVEHAHQHGILHRDLKPSNILVDAEGRPRVLDFGLAKALDEEGDRASRTRSEGFVGTLAYASPEHVEGSTSRLDVRSDVYSLGVVLYEMLTGARPYDPDSGMRAYLNALDREAHPAPSSLRRGLGREVDAVIRRALAPRREDRFGSVGEFAADVRRFLDGQPVLSVHPSVGYELRKLIARHKAIAALSLVILVGSLAFAWHSRRQSRDLARERDAAKAEEQKTVALLDFLVFDMLFNVEPATGGKDVSVGDLLRVAAEGVSTRFADQPELDARVRFYLARTYENLGDLPRAVELFRSALERIDTAPQTTEFDRGACELSLARVLRQVEQMSEAEELYRSAEQRLLAAKTVDYLRVSEAIAGLAACAMARGDANEMRAQNERGLALVLERLPDIFDERYRHRQGLAIAHAMLGELDKARAGYETLLREVEAKFGPGNSRAADLLGRISDIDEAEGRLDDAKENSRRSLEITVAAYGDDHPNVAAALGDLAALMTEPDELAEAETMLRRAVDISRRLRGGETLATLVHETRLAQNVALQGRHEEAIPVLEAAAARFDAALGPRSVWALRSRKSLAQTLSAAGRHDEAIEHWEAACRNAPGEATTPSKARLESYRGLIVALRGADLAEKARDATGEYLELILTDEKTPEEIVRDEVQKLVGEYRAAGDEDAARRWEQAIDEWARTRDRDG